MDKLLGKYAPYIYAILRIMAGLMFAVHGSQKLFGWPGDRAAATLASQTGVAGVIELVGGILIALGLFTSYAAFLASGLMAFAYFLSHHPRTSTPLTNWLPPMNKGELAVLYCFIFLYMAAHGSGVWSLDALRRRGKR